MAAEDCRRALSTRDRNCVCLAGPSRKAPGMWLATLETPGFRMPRMVMQWSDASIGRATPRGRSFALTRAVSTTFRRRGLRKVELSRT